MQLGKKKYFTDDGKLTEYAVYIYAQLRLLDKEEQLPEEVLDMVANDPYSADRVIRKYGELKAGRKKKERKFILQTSTIAASIVLLAAVGLVLYFQSGSNLSKRESPLAAAKETTPPSRQQHKSQQRAQQLQAERLNEKNGDNQEQGNPNAALKPANAARTEQLNQETGRQTLTADIRSASVNQDPVLNRQRLIALQEQQFSYEEQMLFERGLTAFGGARRSAPPSNDDNADPAANSIAPIPLSVAPSSRNAVWDDQLVFDWEVDGSYPASNLKKLFIISVKQQGSPVKSFECDGPPCAPPAKFSSNLSPGLYYWDVYDKTQEQVIIKNKFRYYKTEW